MAARVLPEFWRPAYQEDGAVLQLEGNLPSAVRPLPLGSSQNTINHSFQTFGFPELGQKDGSYGDGHILNDLPMHGTRVLQVSSPQTTLGFSGGPVLDLVTSRIVGMVTAIAAPDKYGRLAETTFITPTETLREICPRLELSDIQPYLGLAAFTEKDAEFFFGRKKTVEALANALKSRPRFLLVMGPSGSGKSSVVQAGLIPSLRKGAVPGSDRWGIVVSRPVDRPFESLEAKGIEGASKDLVDAASLWLKEQAGMEHMLLILDQFEEFLVTCPPILRQLFWAGLKNLLDSDIPITVMAVMRDDFYSRFAQEAPSQVLEWIKRGVFPVSASMEPEDLREIIEQPARRVGLALEEGMAQVIINDVLESCLEEGGRAGKSTVLPLLEFALTQVWQRREQGFLTHQAYNAVGKVTGSLTAWADEVCRSLEKDGLGKLTRRIFTDLVNLGDEAQRLPDSRRRRLLDDLCNQQAEREPVHRVVQKLADARLVTTSTDNGQVTVEIIHDALIREWARLQRWLKKDRNFLSWERELEKDAQEWKDTSTEDISRRDEGRLLRGLRLGQAERWLKERGNELNETEIEFIKASLDLRERDRQKEEKSRAEKERIRRRILQWLAIFSVVALSLASFASIQKQQADDKSEEALARNLVAQSELRLNTALTESVLLAVESLRHKETLEGYTALRHSAFLLPRTISQLDHSRTVYTEAFSPDGRKLAALSRDNTTQIWDAYTGKLLQTLRHDDQVWSLAFSPDGKKLATASYDKTARIWDVETGRQLQRLEHNDLMWAVAFSPDGRKLATASYDKIARIWDVDTGKLLQSLEHGKQVWAIAFSPDGKRLATASDDETARIWDVETGRQLQKLELKSLVLTVVFSPDGKKLAAASYDKTVRIWDVETGRQLQRLELDSLVDTGPQLFDHLAVAFSPDGKKLATASWTHTALIWDVETGKQLKRLEHNRLVEAVAFSHDGTKLVTASGENTALVWDVETGKQLQRLEHDGEVYAVAFSLDGKKLASGDRITSLWDTDIDRTPQRLKHNDTVRFVAFSPDGRKLATASNDKTARIWDADTGRQLQKLEHDYTVRSVAFSPDGRKLATASYDNIARIWDAETGKQLQRLEHDDMVRSVAFSHDGTKLVTASGDNIARIWDAETGKQLLRLEHDNWVGAVAFSPNGKKLASGGRMALIWDANTAKMLQSLEHDSWVNAVAFSPNGMELATASYDKTARIWDVETGRQLLRLKHENSVQSVTFSSDGKRLATASDDNKVLIWDVETGKQLQSLVHDDKANAVAFSPDGKMLATASDDKIARIWDVETGRQLQSLEHDDSVQSVTFSPDGKRLATASDDNTALIWNLDARDLINEACSRVARNMTIEEWSRFISESDCLTCPREGKFNQNWIWPWGKQQCQPCIGNLNGSLS